MEEPRWRAGHELTYWPDLKFARAQQHLNDFQMRLLVWSKSASAKPATVIGKDGLSVEVALDMPVRPPLAEMALSLGDAVHNARSSLDALIWELAHLDGARPARPHRIYFPICVTEKAWHAAVEDLETVPKVAIDRIRTLQPFTATDQVGTPAITFLHRLDVRDKHRTSLECAFQVDELSLDNWVLKFADDSHMPNPPFTIDIVNDGSLQHGQVVVRLSSTAQIVAAKTPMMLNLVVTMETNNGKAPMVPIVSSMFDQVAIAHEIIRYGLEETQARTARATEERPELGDPAPPSWDATANGYDDIPPPSASPFND